MNGNPWWLAIAVDARGGVAGATCIEESDPWRVAGESVGEIVAEALRKHGGMKPVAATLVHPRWMGADTLGEALRDIDRAGVPERLVRTTGDAEVLMASKTSTVSDMVRDGLAPGTRGRLVIVDASSGRVYGVDGPASPVGEGSDVAADAADVVAEVSARLREHGGAGADVALVGLPATPGPWAKRWRPWSPSRRDIRCSTSPAARSCPRRSAPSATVPHRTRGPRRRVGTGPAEPASSAAFGSSSAAGESRADRGAGKRVA